MNIDSIDSSTEYSLSPIGSEEVIESLPPEEQLKSLLIEGGSKEQALTLFKQFFGENLVSRAIPPEFFNQLPKFLGKTECLIALGRIGQSVTFDDLEECVAELKSGKNERLILSHATTSSPRLWWYGKAKNLPSNEIKALLDLFRDPLKHIDPLTYEKPLGKELSELTLDKPTRTGFFYTRYDYEIHQITKYNEESKEPYFHLAHREPMAKLIAYADPSTTVRGMIIPCIDEKTNQLVYYELFDQIHERGLHGYLLTPINSVQDCPAKLIFRGTESFDLESIQRDFESTGVGKITYDPHASRIIEMINTYALGVKHPKIEIMGHSLGGVDAQRTMLNLLHPSISNTFKTITLFAFCSPKLDDATASLMEGYLKYLSIQPKQPELKIVFALHEKDFLARVSDSYLSGSSDYHIPTECFYVKSSSNFQQVNQHHTHPFFKLGKFDEIDGRTAIFSKFLSKDNLEKQIKRCELLLEELGKEASRLEEEEKQLYGYWLTLKSYFVHVKNSKAVKKEIAEVEHQKNELLIAEQALQDSSSIALLTWDIDSAVNAIRIPLNSLVHKGLQYYMDYWKKKS